MALKESSFLCIFRPLDTPAVCRLPFAPAIHSRRCSSTARLVPGPCHDFTATAQLLAVPEARSPKP